MKITGGVAVVTGGARGIGLELAKELLRNKCNVAICDVNEESLDAAEIELKTLAKGSDLLVTVHNVNVADRENVAQFAQDVVESHGKVSMIFNNAGVVVAESIQTLTWEDIDFVMDVNLHGVINMTKVFMPILAKEKEAYVVNTSSLEGIMTVPGNIMYCTSKFAVRGFSEALMLDNRFTCPNVKVCSVHPGFVQTNMIFNNRTKVNPNVLQVKSFASIRERITPEVLSNGFKSIGSTSPNSAARQVVNGVKRNQTRILVGNDAVILDFLFRMFPRLLYNRFLYLPVLALVLIGVKAVGKKTIVLGSLLYMYYRKKVA